ncbi:MAG: hypothetical protein IT385_25790 [Deltaproteobacteria bacterium]|nr:hypothetical protein [Deltaproteobacteria bacterium]
MTTAEPADDQGLEDLAGLAALVRRLAAEDATATVAPSPEARSRLAAAIVTEGRFERFAPAVAAMADVSEARARAWLDGVWGDAPLWERAAPGARAWWVEGGPRARNALRGFVHAPSGGGLPHHAHLGAERVLVIQGNARVSTGERIHAGDLLVSEAGHAHALEVVAGGPDLLIFTVAYEGLDFDGLVARPRS